MSAEKCLGATLVVFSHHVGDPLFIWHFKKAERSRWVEPFLCKFSILFWIIYVTNGFYWKVSVVRMLWAGRMVVADVFRCSQQYLFWQDLESILFKMASIGKSSWRGWIWFYCSLICICIILKILIGVVTLHFDIYLFSGTWLSCENILQTHVLFSGDHGESKHVERVCGAFCVKLFCRNFHILESIITEHWIINV